MRKRADRLLGCGGRETGGGRRESTGGGGANEGTRLASDARVRVPDAGSGVGEVKFARQGKKKMRRRERAGCLFHFQFSPAQEWETLGRVRLGAATLPIPAVPSAKRLQWLRCLCIAGISKSLPVAADPFCAYHLHRPARAPPCQARN